VEISGAEQRFPSKEVRMDRLLGESMKRLIKGLEIKAGFWALFDQGAVSLGNFLTQMLLARNLSWSDYGVFALIYGVLFVLIGALGTVVTYPLSVKGASAEPRGVSRLTGVSLWFNAGLIVPEALIVLCAVAVLHQMHLFLYAFGALFFWQFQETLRRGLMARLGHHEAIWGDGLSYLGQALAIAVLARLHSLSLETAFLSIAITSAFAVALQVLQVKPVSGGLADARALAGDFFRLGSWASATNLANGTTQQAFPWALGLLFGTAEAGSLQALVNPLKIFNPVLISIQNLIVPAAAKAQREQGIRAAAQNGLAYIALGSLLLLPYFVVLLIWPQFLLGILYGFQSPYSHLELELRICVVAYAIGYWADAACSLLNGLGSPRAGFLAQLGAVGAAVIIGGVLIRTGLVGAILSLGICAAVKAGIALYVIWAGNRSQGGTAVPVRAVP